MSILLTIVCVFAQLILYDIVLRTARFIDRKRALSLVDKLCDRVVERIFACLHLYSGVRFEFESKVDSPLPERFLLIANHQSLLDIPLSMGFLPGRRLRFVAKTELGSGIPFISLVLKTQGHALVKRSGDFAQSMQALGHFSRRCLREGSCPVVFPEGTRSKDGELGPFYTAGVRKALEAGSLPIVVAAIEGGWRISTFKDLFSDFRGLRYRFLLAGILPAPAGKKESLDAIETARAIIAAELADMRSRMGA